MLRRSIGFIITAASLLFVTLEARAENRIALVIGQSAYKTAPALPNPMNDAVAMTSLLGKAGFDVTTVSDLSQIEMRRAIADFAGKIAGKGPDTVVAVFYAGHGIQVDGVNFLIPVDVDLKRESDVPLQAVRLDDLMNAISSVPTKMRIVMLDACRNNPFAGINKTTGHGLALVDVQAGSSGTFLSYSTSPGAEAEDGTGASSPYTTALVSAAVEPNIPIEQTFKKVRLAVNKTTEGRQLPWESSSLINEFFFFGKPTGKKKQNVAAQSVETWRNQLKGKPVEAAYELVVVDDGINAYEAFVALFGRSPYGPRVRGILERRREMVAWQVALEINTPDAFSAFLKSYPTSDLAATARKLRDRVRNRSLSANASIAGLNGIPASGSPASGPASKPTLASAPSGPTCPCTTAPPPRKASAPPKKRTAKRRPPRRQPRVVVRERGPTQAERDAAVGGAIAAGVLGGILGGVMSGGGQGHDH